MFNFKQFAQQLVLALAMAVGSGAAVAGPTYEVTIDTADFAGQTGLLDFAFSNGFIGTVGATATLSNFSGAIGAEVVRLGTVSGAIPGVVTITNADIISYLTHAVNLGGAFSFTLNLSGDFETIPDVNQSMFSVALYNDDATALLARLVDFTIVPEVDGNPVSIGIDASDLVAVNQVPEPSALLMVVLALAMAGVASRRRMG